MTPLQRVQARLELAAAAWYHGSPSAKLVLGHRLLFVTQNMDVAKDYAQNRVHFTGRIDGPIKPTIYTLYVRSRNFLNLRMEQHRTLYDLRVMDYNSQQTDKDNVLPRLKSQGFISSHSGLPSFGFVPALKKLFMDFDGMYVDEGSQGISLALFDPVSSAEIINQSPVSGD